MNKRKIASCITSGFLIGTMLLISSCSSKPAGDGAETNETEQTVEQTETSVQVSDLQDAEIQPVEDQIYTGSEITVVPEITIDGTALSEGSDYTLSYDNNINIGTTVVTVTGNGTTVEGETSFTFNIITGDELCDSEENAGLLAFVDRLYVHLLGRYPTWDELTDNTRRLRSGSRSGMDMVNIILQSDEFARRELDEVGFVQAFYLGVLNRNADEDGLWYNVNLLWGGMDRIELANGIMDVEGGEFDNICDSLGISLGTGSVVGAVPVINDGIPSSSFNYNVDGRSVTVHRRVYQYIHTNDDGEQVFDLDAMCADSSYAPLDSSDGFVYGTGVYELSLIDGAMSLKIGGDEISYYEDTVEEGEDLFRVNDTDTEVSIGMVVMIEYSLESIE